MIEVLKNLEYDKFKDNKNGTVVAMMGIAVLGIIIVCKHGIDSLDGSRNG